VREFDLAPLLTAGTNQPLFTSTRTTNTEDCLNLCLATMVQPAALSAPRLSIRKPEGQQCEISWSPPTPGFVLQERTNLALGAWTNSPSGATNPVTVLATLPAKFYRLFKP
jgi:hypothetical protein